MSSTLTKTLTFDTRVAFSRGELHVRALGRTLAQITLDDVMDTEAVQLADTVIITDGVTQRVLKSRNGPKGSN
jgi:hypothetical protein